MIGLKEIGLIAVMFFILFGAACLPKFARSLGEARNEFLKGMNNNQK